MKTQNQKQNQKQNQNLNLNSDTIGLVGVNNAPAVENNKETK